VRRGYTSLTREGHHVTRAEDSIVWIVRSRVNEVPLTLARAYGCLFGACAVPAQVPVPIVIRDTTPYPSLWGNLVDDQ
jgi:hypothetical protein